MRSGRMWYNVTEDEENKKEEGILSCPVCGEVCTIDPNDDKTIFQWVAQHVLGHGEQDVL